MPLLPLLNGALDSLVLIVMATNSKQTTPYTLTDVFTVGMIQVCRIKS
jgi:hypothetical protein